MHQKVNLRDKLSRFDECWVPKIIGELNGQLVKVAKCEGAYVWHHHADEDELFMVISGRMRIELDGDEGQAVLLEPGELYIVPRGVEHRPVAEPGTEILLFEPASTRNTGNVDHGWTIEPEDLHRL